MNGFKMEFTYNDETKQFFLMEPQTETTTGGGYVINEEHMQGETLADKICSEIHRFVKLWEEENNKCE